MQATVEELVLSGDGVCRAQGEVYELLGLDVIYDRETLKIYSTRRAKIKSMSAGIHVHAYYGAMDRLITRGFVGDDGHNMPLEILDLMGNKVVVTFMGREDLNRIAIITSGGDAPGMNSAIKSIVRTGIKWGASVYGVYKGYDGLINNNIRKLGWDTETHGSSQGGTVLLSARSKRFMDREGRKQAALNLIKKRINCLVVLGGDGSLEGALVLKNEFREHFKTLVLEGRFTRDELKKIYARKNRKNRKEGSEEQTATDASRGYSDFYGKPECYKEHPNIYRDLNTTEDASSCDLIESEVFDSFGDDDVDQYLYDLKVVGIPATIDNDLYGTSTSLGENTAIHRVVEAIDHLMSTMKSHSRAFVIEVMGRRCGWIALMSALAGAADYVLLPEAPADWRAEMVGNLRIARKHGKTGVFVIIAEGAVEPDGARIRASEVVKEIDGAGIDVRLLRLGHIQRGGPTSAQDRIYGTLLGVKAVEIMLSPMKEAVMISSFKDGFMEMDLREVIEQNKTVKALQQSLRFDEVLAHRSKLFQQANAYFRRVMTRVNSIEELRHRCKDPREKDCAVCMEMDRQPKRRIGVLQSGKRSSGMNTALNAVVQYALAAGVEAYYIPNGFEGLLGNQVIKASLYEFSGDANNGGSVIGLGTKRQIDPAMIQEKIEKFGLDSLIVIGDSHALLVVEKIRGVNVVFIPASSSNNMPGIDMSIGADTALNAILKLSDVSKLNSFACKNNVFVVEIGGDSCGYLSLMGGIAAGAFEVFIPERKYLIGHLSETAQRLRVRFREKSRRGIVLFRNERTFCSMSTGSFCKALKTDSEDLFDTDFSVLGQLEEGSNPSPVDRINASMLGFKAVDMCLENCGVGVVGFREDAIEFTAIEDVLRDFDRELNRARNPLWLKYSNICRSIE